MVKTRSGLQSSQDKSINQPKVQTKNEQKSKKLKLFSYAFPKRDSPYYFDNLPFFKQQYERLQKRMTNVTKITFKMNDKEKTFNWIKPQPYQYQPSSQNQSQIYSRASTQVKADHCQVRQEMDQSGSECGQVDEQQEIIEQCSYVSSCRQSDIQVEQKIANNSGRDNEMRHQQEQNGLNNREENAQMFMEQELPNVQAQIPQVVFGPLNIDDLSTNQTLNPNSRSIQMQQPNINFIFIENGQNLFENLSEISTKGCMSHSDNSSSINQAINHQLTQEEYNSILWNAQNNLHLYETIGNEEVNIRINYYLNLMLKFKTRQSNRSLNIQEQEQFWSLMSIVGFHFHKANIDKMDELIKNHEQNEPNTTDLEYQLIKERLENINLFLNSELGHF